MKLSPWLGDGGMLCEHMFCCLVTFATVSGVSRAFALGSLALLVHRHYCLFIDLRGNYHVCDTTAVRWCVNPFSLSA